MWRLLALCPCALAHGGALERFPPEVSNVTSFVDNFDFANNATFHQKALTYSAWWRAGNPIFFFFGGEGSVEGFYNASGAVFEHGQALEAMVVFLEHRYYGSSRPSSDLRFLTLEQALADTAWFLEGLRRRLGCGERECPVVTFGGSYGGMMVAWFRQKYPHLTAGGLASSAPIDFYPNDGRQEAFWNATMHTFRFFGSEGCPGEVDKALGLLQQQSQDAAGRRQISEALGSCEDLENETTAGAKVDFFLRGVFATLAMLDYPVASNFVTLLPANPAKVACQRLQSSTDLRGLRRVVDLFLNATGSYRCYDYLAEMVGRATSGQLHGPTTLPDMGHWQYQACNEMPMQSLTSDGMGFYPAKDSQLAEVADSCYLRYGLRPRTAWLGVSLGGSRLHVGQLLFTDGEKDPWRAGTPTASRIPSGVDIVQHLIPAAAHHEDLRFDASPPRAAVLEAKRLARRLVARWAADFRRGGGSGAGGGWVV
ncbi:unnamed protein product [Effrenium voratum]|nr:unnamed protein product [Effrenium voratum]